VSDESRNPDNYCYRHPDRESYIICQRCGRTICPECQTQAAVGVHCPECVKLDRQETPRQVRRVSNPFRNAGNRPVVTYTLIGVNVLVYLLQTVTGGALTSFLAYNLNYTISRPWELITYAFAHLSITHIAFNMFSLFIFGPVLEQLVGRARFLALYLISALGGAVGFLAIAVAIPAWITSLSVAGASGAIFGLMGAYFVIARRLGGNSTQFLVVIVLNLVIGFIPSLGIAWQAHVGGLIVGVAVAFVLLATRRRQQRGIQIAALGGITAALIAITAVVTSVVL
jgi:membrane associated rhomboid family serine protease